MMGILTSDFGMERLYRAKDAAMGDNKVFREPETPTLPSDAPPPRQPGQKGASGPTVIVGPSF